MKMTTEQLIDKKALSIVNADKVVKPQPGPQLQFLESRADIVISGGGAGGGKTVGLLLLPIKYIRKYPRFGMVIFRREFPQITAEGGLWDQSMDLYRHLGGIPREGYHDWRFPNGSKIRFAHMQREDDRHSWDGSEIPLICFDQAESFTWKQISYMFSRNRSTCGVRPHMRMTCNPDPDCWLREFLKWWIDDDSGLAIKERSGVVRYFVNINNEVIWGDNKDELRKKHGPDCRPKSCTFIPSSIFDNKILMDADPGYLASLQALPLVERERLLGCNWNIRYTAGNYFKREWFEIVDAVPATVDAVRYWDRAAVLTKPGEEDKASWTAGLCMGKSATGVYYIMDVSRFQDTPLKVKEQIKNIASQDGNKTRIGIEQDPGQAGKAEAQDQARNLTGYRVTINVVRESKGKRAEPLSAQVEAGNVKIVRGRWNEAFLREMQNFDGSPKCVSDQVDAASGAFYLLTQKKRGGVWGKR
jgi:predicted phage terminase large subunit-like protein